MTRPWFAPAPEPGRPGVTVVDAEGEIVALVYGFQGADDLEKRRRLIAAAPVLHAALVKARDALLAQRDTALIPLIHECNRAIVAAEGHSS